VISDNTSEGIYGCNGPIQGNAIVRNSAGLAYANGLIRDNHISANGDAGGMYYCNGEIVGNMIVGNTASPNGGGLFGCRATIRNNIIAGNRADGDGGGLYDCAQLIQNNTIVGNVATANGGGLALCLATTYNNIIAYNEATLAGGIFGASFNTYNAFWGNTGGHFGGDATSGAGDVVVNPQFVREGHWDTRETETVADDPLSPEAGRFHVIRGASWRSATVTELRLASRHNSAEGDEKTGFRIARNLE